MKTGFHRSVFLIAAMPCRYWIRHSRCSPHGSRRQCLRFEIGDGEELDEWGAVTRVTPRASGGPASRMMFCRSRSWHRTRLMS